MAKTKTKSVVTALQAAKDEVEQLAVIEREQMSMLEQYKLELAELTAGRGERVLSAIRVGDGDKVSWAESQVVAGKQAQIDTCNDVLSTLKEQREAAAREVVERKADCLFAEADELDKQADERQVHTDELLDQLREWEGVEYEPIATRTSEKAGIVRRGERQFPDRPTAHGDHLHRTSKYGPSAGDGVAAPDVVIVHISITEGLRRQASFYRTAAKALLDGGPVPKSMVYPLPDYL